MPTKTFNGNEIEWLMGETDRIVQTIPLEGTSDAGYQMKDVIVKHPDGRLYKFTYYYDTEHGMTMSSEHPDRGFEAVEVKAVPITTYRYEPV